MRHASKFKRAVALSVLILLAGCQTIPADALKLSPESLKERQLQTRVFETADEMKVLSACTALLQDLGFTIEETESKLGLVLGSKDRSAVSAGQVFGAILISAFTGAAVPWDKNQKMRACIVTKPIGDDKKRVAVRVTFQRIVWNTNNQVTRREGLNDPKIYQEFFDKLSKSLFLEAQEVI